MCCAEVDPQQAMGRAEPGHAAVHAEIAIMFCRDRAVLREKERDDGGKRLMRLRWSPHCLWLFEEALQQGLEARVYAEIVGAAVGAGLGVLPEPLQVVGGV